MPFCQQFYSNVLHTWRNSCLLSIHRKYGYQCIYHWNINRNLDWMQHLNVTIDIQFHFNVIMDNHLHYFVNLFHISVTSEKLEAILRSYAWLPSVTFQHHFYPFVTPNCSTSHWTCIMQLSLPFIHINFLSPRQRSCEGI